MFVTRTGLCLVGVEGRQVRNQPNLLANHNSNDTDKRLLNR
jgi:hypothetical protein